MNNEITPFSELDLSPEILKAVNRMGFTAPTPVQAQTIPLMRKGGDVIAKAPTGTGKTIVFSSIVENRVTEGDRVLILAHRGELLDQAADKLAKYCS